MTNDEPAFEHKAGNGYIKVYANRVEILSKSGLGAMFAKPVTVPMRAIQSVSTTITGKIVIMTADNKKHEFTIGPKAKDAEQAILSKL
jgi:hypothetical protein